MSSINKNILRGVLISSYIVIIAVCVYGISALYSYLNTGADRSTMLHTELKKIDQYLPKINWTPLNNEGRPMDRETLKAIENDYLDAWYVKSIAYKTNTKQGIEDYYTSNARQNIYNTVTTNSAEGITIASTSLEHHPTLEFFSEDGQLAVITDRNVVEYKRVYNTETLLLETTETSTYKVVLLLEDGFWRIRHMVKQQTEITKEKNSLIPINNLVIKGINYYPKETPWDVFGKGFNIETIAEDLKIIKTTGLNTIRVFVPYEDFGKANINPEKLEKLKQLLDTAEAQQLKVVITLFDFYGDYSVLDWTLTHRHAETLVSALKNHHAILAWDIKNEPNLDFESRNASLVTAWLKQMLLVVKSADPNHPVTIGWSNSDSANILKDEVDFVSFHYYESLDDLEATFTTLKENIPNKPIVLSEFGISSYSGFWNFFGSSEATQADYHKTAQAIIKQQNIPYMSWTLYDFNNVPKAVVGRLPWRRNIQKNFGFISIDGTKKMSFEFITKSEE